MEPSHPVKHSETWSCPLQRCTLYNGYIRSTNVQHDGWQVRVGELANLQTMCQAHYDIYRISHSLIAINKSPLQHLGVATRGHNRVLYCCLLAYKGSLTLFPSTIWLKNTMRPCVITLQQQTPWSLLIKRGCQEFCYWVV
jgi:hypothetical protein